MASSGSEKKRILLVDDTYCNRFLTQKILTKAGFEVIEAENGAQGLQKAADKPDLVILDVNLPDIHGFEVCQRIRKDPRICNLPILHLSADNPDTQSKIRGLEGGADGYLVQPVEAGVLVATIKALLRVKSAEDALRESETRFRAVFEEIGIGMVVVDGRGRILNTNRAFRSMFEYPAENLQKMVLPQLFYSEDFEKNRLFIEQIFANALHSSPASENRYLKSDGRLFWGRQTISVVRNGGGDFEYAVFMIEDITLKREAQREKESLQQQLLQSQKMEAVGTLAGGIAHDFNNILTAIQGYCDLALLRSYDPDNNPNEDLQEIKIAADRAAALTQQLLVFSRKQNFKPIVLDLNTHIEAFQKMLRRIIGEHIHIELDLARDLPLICADKANVDQIIMNLVVNARNAMPEGGVLKIGTAFVDKEENPLPELGGGAGGEYVCLYIRDAGVGIKPEIMARIFEPFFTTQEVGKGTGLGLSVVYGIVRQHEGAIRVESEEGKGTCFRVYLPAYNDGIAQRFKIETEKLQVGSKGGRILVVEDEESIGNLLATILPKNGFVVSIARNKRRAKEIFQEKKGGFDLILCDVVLPDGNGLELIDELVAQRPELRILMSSGYADGTSRRKEIEMRKMHFIAKPYHIADLLVAIEKAVGFS